MSDLEFKTTAKEASFSIGDASGYRFDIRANLDAEWGWMASVTINTFGMKTEDAALEHLIPSAEQFIRMLKEHFAAEKAKS